jgi:hypothetical protein
MRQYGFDFPALANVLQTQNITSFTGNITLAANNIPIFANSHIQMIFSRQIIFSTMGK